MDLMLATTGGGQMSSAEVVRVLIIIGLVMLVVIFAGAGLMILRRRVLSNDGPHPESLMQDLRQMRDSGAMTTEEYDLARKRLAARLAGKADGPPANRAPLTGPKHSPQPDKTAEEAR